MDLSFVPVAAIISFAVILALFALIGALRGVVKTGVSVVGNIVAIVLSMLLTPTFVGLFFGDLINSEAKEIMKLLPQEVSKNSDLRKQLVILMTMAAAAILFSVVYLLFFLLLKIPQIFINKGISAIGKKADKGNNSDFDYYDDGPRKLSAVFRITGAVVGLLNGLVFFVVMFSTLVGLLFTVSSITARFVKDTKKTPFITSDCNEVRKEVKNIDEILEPADDAAVFSIVYNLGGSFIYEQVTTIESKGKTISINEEADEIYFIAMAALRATDLMQSDFSDKLMALVENKATVGGEKAPQSIQELLEDPEVKDSFESLTNSLAKVDDFEAVVSEELIDQLMKESGVDLSTVSSADKREAKQYINDYIDDNYKGTERKQLRKNIQNILDSMGLDIEL